MPPTAHSQTTFGAVLQRLRRAAGLSQEELAERAGVSARAVSDLERGVRQSPRPATLRLLIEALSLSEPERAQLIAAANHEVADAVPTPSRHTLSDLPVLSTPILGREADLAEVTALLRQPAVRLVTLTGMGGIGKTRLALEIAHNLAEDFTHGVAFVDMSPITDPALVLPAIASTLGLRDAGDQPLLDLLTSALRQQELLLVVDNCEQVLGASTDLAALLATCPSLTMLVTSREALRLRGEREWPVAPLPLPQAELSVSPATLSQSPAVALFVARAKASDPRFALSAENAAAVAAICQRLEGVPLALELAAPRIKLLSAEVLAERVQQPLPLLTGGARDAPARHSTLRDTIAWSYDLLTADEQALFRRLGVFVGGWSLEAAEAIANVDGRVAALDGIASLLDKSLIRREDGASLVRYGMFETVREFAHEQLVVHGEAPAIQLAHARYFLALAEHSMAPVQYGEQQKWLPSLDADYPNIRQAFATFEALGDDESSLRLANGLKWFWYMHAQSREGLPRFAGLLERYQEQNSLRAEALPSAAMIAYGCGDYDQADRWLDEGEELARALGERLLLAYCALVRGTVAEHRGDEGGAERAYSSGLVIAQEIGATWLIGVLLGNLDDAAYRRGDLDLAERYSLAALSVLQQTGNPYVESMTHVSLAQVALARGVVEQAVGALTQALEIAEAIDSRLNRANVIAGAAAVCAAQGRCEQAVRLLGAADAERERSGHPLLPHFGLVSKTQVSIRSSLTPTDYDRGWAEGRGLSSGDAVAAVRALFAEASTCEERQPHDETVPRQPAG